MGLLWEEFKPGDEWLTRGRAIKEVDVIAFARLSGDLNPLHTDLEYCRKLGLPGLVPQTNLVIAAASGLIADLGLFDQTGVALVRLTWRVISPVSIGDIIRCRVRIADVQELDSAVGLVVREVTVLNQKETTVHQGSHEVHVRRRRS